MFRKRSLIILWVDITRSPVYKTYIAFAPAIVVKYLDNNFDTTQNSYGELMTLIFVRLLKILFKWLLLLVFITFKPRPEICVSGKLFRRIFKKNIPTVTTEIDTSNRGRRKLNARETFADRKYLAYLKSFCKRYIWQSHLHCVHFRLLGDLSVRNC